MNNYEDAMQYIETQEATNISYVKIGNGNKKLVVNFASNSHDGFEQKKSLMSLKYERNDFDVLYLRNRARWYIGGLNGIGKNINHTIAFLKKEFSKYDKVLCIGFSAGGYASFLFGSLLNINKVVAIDAQTDLEYVKNKLPYYYKLASRAKECPTTWSKYNKIFEVINYNVTYNVFYKSSEKLKTTEDHVLHGNYHYDLIKHFPNVIKLDSWLDGIAVMKKFIEE